MRDWEKLARACRRYLDAYGDEIADDVTLGSVGNDLRIIAIREISPAPPRVFFPGDTVPAGTALMLDDGSLLEADTVDERQPDRDGPAVELLGIPTLAEFQSAVDRARAEREANRDG